MTTLNTPEEMKTSELSDDTKIIDQTEATTASDAKADQGTVDLTGETKVLDSPGKKKQPKEQKKMMPFVGAPKWGKLDNTAQLFPVIANDSMSNVYRISVNLTEEIMPGLLRQAAEWLVPQLTIFKMRIRNGIFWFYFEENDRPLPPIREEQLIPGAPIIKQQNEQYLFRISYFGKRINLEVFHALTDGYGGIVFLQELIYKYLRLLHPEELSGEKDKLSEGLFLDYEDSYLKSVPSAKRAGSPKKTYQKGKGYQIKGEKLPAGEMGLTHVNMKVSELKEVCKRYGVTINQYLVSAYIYAIDHAALEEGKRRTKPLRCCVPVNLRPFYNSHTMKNFFVMVTTSLEPEEQGMEFEALMRKSIDQLNAQIGKEQFDATLAWNVNKQTKPIHRIVPLFIKVFLIRQVYLATAAATTTTITNIGSIPIAEPYRPYVEKFYAMISMSKGQNLKAGIVSYANTLTVTFTSSLKSLNVQREFVKRLTDDGIEVAVETNGSYEEE